MKSVWDFMLSLLVGSTSLYVFLVPVLVMGAFSVALRLAHNRYF